MEEPESVKAWRIKVKELSLIEPPRCCFTCDEFKDGYCRHFGAEVPADFAATEGACPEWFEEIPF